MDRARLAAFAATVVALSLLLLGFTSGARPSPIELIDPERVIHPFIREDAEGPATGEFRSIDGTGNHTTHFTLGATDTPLRRVHPDAYGDDVSSMAGAARPRAREISNFICAEDQRTVNSLGASDFVWQWGQFLDHDIDLTESVAPFEPAHVAPEANDPFFDPDGDGLPVIIFHRSVHASGTGVNSEYPRQQLNLITHYIDASNVYGSDEERATALRTLDGSGKLKVSPGNLLPFNTEGLENAGGTGAELFLAGDIRANEQVGLAAMHTLFVREHNRRVDEIASIEPGLSGDELYERARAFLGGLMQGITYNEFLPALLGPDALPPYAGYDRTVSPAIQNVFSTVAFRFGHSAVSDQLQRLDSNGNIIPFGNLPLRDAFFAPERILLEGGIEPLLRGLAAQEMSKVDTRIVDGLRNFLFGPPTAGGLDLVSLNIQRGRDHGLADYASIHLWRGLGRITSFGQISSNPEVQSLLAVQYGSVSDIDAWVGGISEDPVNGGHVGKLFFEILVDQFEKLRDGDRYWYEVALPIEDVLEINETTLADVIRRNTSIDTEIDDDVFHVN